MTWTRATKSLRLPVGHLTRHGTRTIESMSDDELQEQADRALEDALAETDSRDPRDFYRERLRELRDRNTSAYDAAVRYYREELLPAVADDDHDPLAAWTEYGRVLAELTAPGRTVVVDETGRAAPYEAPTRPEGLILHLPDARSRPALLVGLPPELSEAQRSTYDWLVAGRQRSR